jgi:DNA replication protein DnaC
MKGKKRIIIDIKSVMKPGVTQADIAAKMGSEFELTHLLNIIDNRLALGKSNIYTSNLNRQQLYNALGERLTSRIANMSIDIELRGSDKRNLKVGE